MAGRPLRLLVVGKLRQGFLREGCGLYAERLSRFRALTITEVHDADSALPPEKRVEQEAENLLRAIRREEALFVLDERGKHFSSKDLAALIREYDLQGKNPCFLIGGPFGLAQRIRQKADNLFSLSCLTFPHELARLILLEQLYRAETILRNIPYHHE